MSRKVYAGKRAGIPRHARIGRHRRAYARKRPPSPLDFTGPTGAILGGLAVPAGFVAEPITDVLAWTVDMITAGLASVMIYTPELWVAGFITMSVAPLVALFAGVGVK